MKRYTKYLCCYFLTLYMSIWANVFSGGSFSLSFCLVEAAIFCPAMLFVRAICLSKSKFLN